MVKSSRDLSWNSYYVEQPDPKLTSILDQQMGTRQVQLVEIAIIEDYSHNTLKCSNEPF
ncbi:unnamed protein product [Acidithrix sp. C25]|nr:unnamed protein product [Acidithrix sp. C25]